MVQQSRCGKLAFDPSTLEAEIGRIMQSQARLHKGTLTQRKQRNGNGENKTRIMVQKDIAAELWTITFAGHMCRFWHEDGLCQNKGIRGAMLRFKIRGLKNQE